MTLGHANMSRQSGQGVFMKYKCKRGIIIKRNDGSELVRYNDSAFPAYVHAGWMLPDVTWANNAHFHEDLEFIHITKGNMAYNVNGEEVALHTGDTLMVNSGHIHYSLATEKERCSYIIYILKPLLLCSSYVVEKQYVNPIIENKRLPYILFRANTVFGDRMQAASERMIETIPAIFEPGDAFAITKEFFSVWEIVMEYCRGNAGFLVKGQPGTAQDSFKRMSAFIQSEYRNKITLEDIANAGHVSKSYCNMIFRRYAGVSPVEALLKFRAKKVCEYLYSSEMNMSEIAFQTGFSSASYMTEIFRRYYKMSPRAYKSKMVEM